MKTKNEILGMSKRWMTETAGIHKDRPTLVVVRDNAGAGENTSNELNDYFTEHGLKNYFRTPYEQWQNRLAEASVNSVTIFGRTVMAESRWFSATIHGVNCKNTTNKERLGTTPHEKLYPKKKDALLFRPY
jgi:hypothetical protein